MWIRSKDKTRLLNVNFVETADSKILGYQFALFAGDYSCNSSWGSDNDINLGEYDTHERAIEVLDDIQRGIELNSTRVFQMPEK